MRVLDEELLEAPGEADTEAGAGSDTTFRVR